MSNPKDNGWQESAAAWIADIGEHGDFGRQYVLDPVMLPRALACHPHTVLDVGCGEGRFCRMLAQQGIQAFGIDPTPNLIAAASARGGSLFAQATAEALPFGDACFDLVVSYLTLIDIPDLPGAIGEMNRVLKPGGTFLIANLNSFNTAQNDYGVLKRYMEERAEWCSWRGIRIQNYHGPFRTYVRTLLDAGLQLRFFDEPTPVEGAPEPKAVSYLRAPWFLVMEWTKPAFTAIPDSQSQG